MHSHIEGVKRLAHPKLGSITLEYSAFAVDGRADLAMIVYTPVDEETAERIRTLAEQHSPSTAVPLPEHHSSTGMDG